MVANCDTLVQFPCVDSEFGIFEQVLDSEILLFQDSEG